MAQEFAPAVVADLRLMVVRGLPRWGMPPATSVTMVNLSENATFALRDPATGRTLALRVHRVGYSSAVEIRSELAWISALLQDGAVETAAPVLGSNGEFVQVLESASGGSFRYAVAFEWLPGTAPDTGVDAVPWFERLGELTARMHRHARSWSPPAGFARRRWDLDGMVGPKGYLGSWRSAIGLDGSGIAALEEALNYIALRLERFGSGINRFGLVHADLRLANLLVDGVRLRIIDFDDCGFSWFMYDFATAVSFIEHEPIVSRLLAAWCAGYRRIAPLAAEDQAEIPTFVVLRRILLSAWLASHSEVAFARQFGVAHTQGTVRLAQLLLRERFLNAAVVT